MKKGTFILSTLLGVPALVAATMHKQAAVAAEEDKELTIHVDHGVAVHAEVDHAGTAIFATIDDPESDAIHGINSKGRGVIGESQGNKGGVVGTSTAGDGVAGVAFGVDGAGIVGVGHKAGSFKGSVGILGAFKVNGVKVFQIDHPLDPAHKYLSHSCVESADMMNVYNGNAVLDADGKAIIQLPEWFEALNRDFRFQLTAIGAPSPGLYVSEEVQSNRFGIAGGAPGARVSWQITGIRQDAWANAHPLQVEEAKPANEQGRFSHPELFGESDELGIAWRYHGDVLRHAKERRLRAVAIDRK